MSDEPNSEPRPPLPTHEEQERIAAAIKWLIQKWGDEATCPYCGNDAWGVGIPVSLLTDTGRAIVPLLPAVCTNCGHTAFVDARTAGVEEVQGQPGEDGE